MVAQIYEILDVQMLYGQQCLTRFHYLDEDGAGDPAQLLLDYHDQVIPLLRPWQSSSVSHVALRYRKVYPTADLMAEQAISPTIFGSDGPGDTTPWTSYSVKFNIGGTVHLAGSDLKHIKKGGKHLPGVVIGEAGWVGAVDSTHIANAALWAAKAIKPSDDNWELVVASFQTTAESSVNTPATRTVTKGGRQDTISKYAKVVSASAPALSTQNTRKILRGRTY